MINIEHVKRIFQRSSMKKKLEEKFGLIYNNKLKFMFCKLTYHETQNFHMLRLISNDFHLNLRAT